MRNIIFLMIMAVLSACGVKGKLYLPDGKKPAHEDYRPTQQYDPYSPEMTGESSFHQQSEKPENE